MSVALGWGDLPLVEAQDTQIQLNNWAEGAPGTDNGASRDYYNRAARLRWANFMGDWADATDQPQGDTPFSTALVSGVNSWISWDVTNLVELWRTGTFSNQGFFLRNIAGNLSLNIRSKEFSDTSFAPQLEIIQNGESTILPLIADTYLDETTFASLGDSQRLRISGARPTLVRFDLGGLEEGTPVESATLKLYAYESSGSGTATIGVFRSNQSNVVPNRPVTMGLAENYLDDVGIETHPDVVFVERWDAEGWENRGWVIPTPQNYFYELTDQYKISGKGLEVEIRQGRHNGINAQYWFENNLGYEPEEMYFRYYVRLANDWDVQVQTGHKFPGWGAKRDGGANGGATTTGFNGWSERGHFFINVPEGNPAANHTALGTYDYHVDKPGIYGTTTYWQDNYGGLIEKNRWYCIEFYLKMNTVDEALEDEANQVPAGRKDGIMRVWVDGKLSYEATNWRWRHVNRLKIQHLWFIVHFGGTETAPENYHMHFDNLVVAKSYIGPRVSNGSGDSDPPEAVQNLQVQ